MSDKKRKAESDSTKSSGSKDGAETATGTLATAASLSSSTASATDTAAAQAEYYKQYYAYYEKRGNWEQFYDPQTQRLFYRHVKSLVNTWDKPPEWDLPCAVVPVTTMTEAAVQEKKKKKKGPPPMEEFQKKYLKRPARKQVEFASNHAQHQQESTGEYNIWYHRVNGSNFRQNRDNGPAESRCSMDTDCGYTKADQSGNHSYFCIHFARGLCHKGSNCNFFHRIPTLEDEPTISMGTDCFGRERHRAHRDDMGGVGAFDSDCKTLYLGGLPQDKGIDDLVFREFSEWGTPVDCRVIHRRNIAFVRYASRLNAEFAKIAMSSQMLGGLTLLNVRWAHEDPNPRAQAFHAEQNRQKLVTAAVDRGLIDYEAIQAEAKKPKVEGAGESHLGDYPDTSDQYGGYSYSATDPAYEAAAQAAYATAASSNTAPAGAGPLTAAEIQAEEERKKAEAAMSKLDAIFSRQQK